MQIPIVRYNPDDYEGAHVPNPKPGGWKDDDEDHFVVQEALETALAERGWRVKHGDDEVELYIDDNQYNDNCYHYLEVLKREAMTAEMLETLIGVLQQYPPWGIGITNIQFAYMLVFGDRIMACGWPLHGCNDLESLAAAVARNLWGVSGEVDRYTEYGRDLKKLQEVGCYDCCTLFASAAIRDWADPDSDGLTAHCPHCGAETVVGAKLAPPLTVDNLRELNALRFGPPELRD